MNPDGTCEYTDSLNERAQYLLNSLVARYIEAGQPVGSNTLTQDSQLGLSAATVRNVMADLERLGFIHAPHTSAGRIPTAQGYRFFVDSLLKVKPLKPVDAPDLLDSFPETESTQQLIDSASSLLSSLTHFVGLVTVPKRERFAFKHAEFLRLSSDRVLAVLVFSDGEVQNRVIPVSRNHSDNELHRVANYLNQHYCGLTLAQVKRRLVKELRETRRELYERMGEAISLAEFAFVDESDDDLVLSGQTNLMDCGDLSDMETLRHLFAVFNRKQELLGLLEQCIQGRGIRLFIGEESGYQALGECSVVTAPYAVKGQVVGVLGVIGPTRMHYDRVIPIVDATARLLGAALHTRTRAPAD